ncbi:Cyclin-T1-4 [Morella rubra]|uniref:Cyclin-T1-4 n=1 Tax=Morella rubra TaxID=262757 RepID=A0A6A1VMW2_9ROSI|nr:Cyclin-T1-4 [Morella rubra]
MCVDQPVQKQKMLPFALRGLIATWSYFLFAFLFKLIISGVKSPAAEFFLGVWLRSSLWLQFKPHHIAAGAVYLAAKFLNLDLASYQNIWQEFQTTPSIIQGIPIF